MTTIINIYGGPGIGKSTFAAGLFYFMKKHDANVELVLEPIKKYCFSGRPTVEEEDLATHLLFDEIFSRFTNLVDYIVTDSPFLIPYFYIRNKFLQRRLLAEILTIQNQIHIWLPRNLSQTYKINGRLQTAEEALKIDNLLRKEFDRINPPGEVFDFSDKLTHNEIMFNILGKFGIYGK